MGWFVFFWPSVHRGCMEVEMKRQAQPRACHRRLLEGRIPSVLLPLNGVGWNWMLSVLGPGGQEAFSLARRPKDQEVRAWDICSLQLDIEVGDQVCQVCISLCGVLELFQLHEAVSVTLFTDYKQEFSLSRFTAFSLYVYFWTKSVPLTLEY